ncbi:MAG: glutamyl-tRNA(Gln) amidotransferase subunit C [Planctomycetota bacterium]|nr:MAG: glutamyl-tRNA(Gln) amidotransferase subunit C [Planctomycetota bacterium]
MALSPESIEHLALLSRLALSAEDKRLFHDQLNRIVEAVERIGELDLQGVAPLSHVVPVPCPLREDEPAPSLPREEALAAAPERTIDAFVVPRVIEEG